MSRTIDLAESWATMAMHVSGSRFCKADESRRRDFFEQLERLDPELLYAWTSERVAKGFEAFVRTIQADDMKDADETPVVEITLPASAFPDTR